MRRRSFLASAGALALPTVVRAESASVIRYVPAADIASLDPVWTTASQTRDHAFLVYDMLYGLDDALMPQPQMVAGHVVEADGRRWTLTLRPGLLFHDGTPVLARDAVASIRRWGRRDSFGQLLMAATDDLAATDDRTLVFRLKQPFPQLPYALGKLSSLCVVMPERLALTDAFTQVTEPTGSGPFRDPARRTGAGQPHGLRAQRRPTCRAAEGVASSAAGPKVAHFERVEWVVMPDGATASAALRQGEVDWLRWPLADLLPQLRAGARHRRAQHRAAGAGGHLPVQPPAPAVRRPRRAARGPAGAVAGRLHDGGQRRGPPHLERRRGVLLPGHADGERGGDGRTDGAARPRRRPPRAGRLRLRRRSARW